jgi:hypothetical protein
MLRIRLRRYRDALGKNNSAAGATSHRVQSLPRLHIRCRQPPLKMIERLAIDREARYCEYRSQ